MSRILAIFKSGLMDFRSDFRSDLKGFRRYYRDFTSDFKVFKSDFRDFWSNFTDYRNCGDLKFEFQGFLGRISGCSYTGF